jgi:hypothetical protein
LENARFSRESRGISGNLQESQGIYLYRAFPSIQFSENPEKYSPKVFPSLAFSANPRENFPGIYSLSKALAGVLLVPLDSLRDFQPLGIAENRREDFSENPVIRWISRGILLAKFKFSEILRESWENISQRATFSVALASPSGCSLAHVTRQLTTALQMKESNRLVYTEAP